MNVISYQGSHTNLEQVSISSGQFYNFLKIVKDESLGTIIINEKTNNISKLKLLSECLRSLKEEGELIINLSGYIFPRDLLGTGFYQIEEKGTTILAKRIAFFSDFMVLREESIQEANKDNMKEFSNDKEIDVNQIRPGKACKNCTCGRSEK